MNKGRRQEIKMLKYKKRIARFAWSLGIYISRNGERIHNPKRIDVLKDNGQHCYRTTSTPCSCMACHQPEKMYNRAAAKRSVMIEDADCCVPHLEANPRRGIPYKFRNSVAI